MSEPTRRERERQQRRCDILDAASRVFAIKGYSETTMDDIASEAELSKGTLYLYFESKDALSLALANRLLDQTIGIFTDIAAGGGTGAVKYKAMLLAYSDNLIKNEQKFRVMVGRLASKTPVAVESKTFLEHRKRVGEVVALLVGAVAEGQRDGTIREDVDPLSTAAESWGGVVGVTLMTMNFEELNRRFPQPIDADRIVPDFVDLLVRGLRSTP